MSVLLVAPSLGRKVFLIKVACVVKHSQLIEQILRSDKKMGEKMMALNFARKDNEFLIKGVVPNRFLKPLGE